MYTSFLLRQNEVGDMSLYAIENSPDWSEYFRHWTYNYKEVVLYLPDLRRNLKEVEFRPYCFKEPLFDFTLLEIRRQDRRFLKNYYIKIQISSHEYVYMPVAEARRIIKENHFDDLYVSMDLEGHFWIAKGRE